MMYTLDGRQFTDKEAEEQKKRNDEIMKQVNETGDFQKLLEIEWLLSAEVYENTGK